MTFAYASAFVKEPCCCGKPRFPYYLEPSAAYAVRGSSPHERLLYFLFFCSGFSGLIYQVVWVRVFGNVFGNTIYSASLVVAVFMLGLGAGSYVVGAWADRRYAERPDRCCVPTRTSKCAIAALGLGISALLPHLEQVSALVSSYSRDAQGWYVLSPASYLARGAIAVVLLTPITILMGGTLTLLIRHLVRSDVEIGRVAHRGALQRQHRRRGDRLPADRLRLRAARWVAHHAGHRGRLQRRCGGWCAVLALRG